MKSTTVLQVGKLKAIPNPKLNLRDEFITWEEAYKLCQTDAPKVTTKIEYFCVRNHFQYYVAANTWAAIINPIPDYSRDKILRDWITKIGLVTAISSAATLSDRLIHDLDEGRQWNWDDNTNSVLGYLLCDKTDREVLDCLRYLKRFSLDAADLLQSHTLSSFTEILEETNWGKQAKLRSIDPSPTPEFRGSGRKRDSLIFSLVRKHLGKILKGFGKKITKCQPSLSNGNCKDAKNTLEKLAALSLCMPNLGGDINFPLPPTLWNHLNKAYYNNFAPQYFDPFDYKVSDEDSKIMRVRKKFARNVWIPSVRCVPKNYKGYRVIAPESTYSGYLWQRVRKALIACIEDNGYTENFDVHTQEPNRIAAFVSSYTGSHITVDLSSASDRIARYIMEHLLPEDVWMEIVRILPVAFEVEGRIYPPSIFLTSGNPGTFMFLGIFVLACMLAARDLHKIYTGKTCKISECIVFGDDGVVPTEISEEFLSILEHMGLKVNYDKTFSGDYRESCGVEFYKGYELTSNYWPRTFIDAPAGIKKSEYLSSLVDLQRKLATNSRASAFMAQVVLTYEPRMTFSAIGDMTCTDMWTLFPCPEWKYSAPYDKGFHIANIPEDYWDALKRYRHLGVKSRPAKMWDLIPDDVREVIDLYRYYLWLEEGPLYEDDLMGLIDGSKFMELIGHSKPQASSSMIGLKPDQYWTLTNR